ncbi:MAG TPA: hypothetical protein VHE23_01375 [Candidatus Acidoferrales bacterium]|nr:hypothetical protein [Candidatus Acidoferrales bacterium]
MKRRIALATACPILLILLGAGNFPLLPQEEIPALQARFDQETNSREKTRLLVRLGNAQFLESRYAGHRGDYMTVGFLMEKYRDNVRIAFGMLRKNHPKAESDYGGYRTMELHLHKSLHELEETIFVAPPEYHPPLQLVRKDLEEIEDELLRLLFPRRPGEKAPAPPKTDPPPK